MQTLLATLFFCNLNVSLKETSKSLLKNAALKLKKINTCHLQRNVYLFRKLQVCGSVSFFSHVCVLSGILSLCFSLSSFPLPPSLSPFTYVYSPLE